MVRLIIVMCLACLYSNLSFADSQLYSPPPLKGVPMDRALTATNAGDGYQGYDADTDVLSLSNSQQVDLGSDGFEKGLATWSGGSNASDWPLSQSLTCQNVRLGCSDQSQCQFASVRQCEYGTTRTLKDIEDTTIDSKVVKVSLYFFSPIFSGGRSNPSSAYCPVCPDYPENSTQLSKLQNIAGVR